jgi:sugar lactone lactonase YvrE
MVVALPSMIGRVDGDGSVFPIASIPHDPTALRMNDGKVDATGHLWVGSIGWRAEPGLARLYRVDPNGSVATMLEGLTISNGIGWSPDLRTLYHIETATRRVDAFDFDTDTARIGNRRALIEFGVGDGYPDGMAVDAEGGLWIAMWDGGCLRRHLPDGSPDRVISIGTPRPTSCVFGGPDLGTLFITSARVGLDPDVVGDTHAGGLFSIRPGVIGLPGHRFAG